MARTRGPRQEVERGLSLRLCLSGRHIDVSHLGGLRLVGDRHEQPDEGEHDGE